MNPCELAPLANLFGLAFVGWVSQGAEFAGDAALGPRPLAGSKRIRSNLFGRGSVISNPDLGGLVGTYQPERLGVRVGDRVHWFNDVLVFPFRFGGIVGYVNGR